MDSITKYYKNLSEKLEVRLNRLLNEVARKRPDEQSYVLPDGTRVDSTGMPLQDTEQPPPDLLAVPPQNELPPLISAGEPGTPGTAPLPSVPQPGFPQPQVPSYPTQDPTPPGYVPGTSPGQGFAPTPTGVMPPQPKPAPAPVPAAPDTSEEDFASARTRYYARRNQQAKDEAEENLARIRAIDMSKQSASGRAQIAVNKLRAERALKRDRFSDEDIKRMVVSDTKERFMSPEEKAARAERTRAGAAALSAEAEKRYGPSRGVSTTSNIDDDKPISPFYKITRRQFRETYGRDFNSSSPENMRLLQAMQTGGLVQQTAQTADAMNQAYATQNAELRKREGQLDRAVDASQIELDRYRNLTPAQRQAEVRAEIQRTQAQPGFVQGVAQDMATGVSAETARRAAERQAFERRAAQPGRVGIPSLLARPEQAPTPNTPQLLSRPEGSPSEAPSLLQAPFAQPPARPSYTGAGSIDYGKAPELLQAPENQIPPYRGIGSRTYSPAPAAQTVGGQVTQRASTMNAQPMSGRVSPTAPVAAPIQPLGATITPPARQQPMPQPTASPGVTNTGGMNATGSIEDFDKEQQTGGPSESNRALPSPTQNPFAIRKPRGGAVTRAAQTFRSSGRIA